MTKIDLTTPSQRELFGLEAETVLIPSQRGKKGNDYPRWGRDDARQMILQFCAHHERTLLEIAKHLDRSKSPHLRAMVYEMCHEQILFARKDVTHNHLTVYKFIAR